MKIVGMARGGDRVFGWDGVIPRPVQAGGGVRDALTALGVTRPDRDRSEGDTGARKGTPKSIARANTP